MSNTSADFTKLAYAYGTPIFRGLLKTKPEDFVVEEVISYELSGEGEHLWCWVEKCGQNTDWVAGALAKWAQTSKRNIGYAGKKDRNAVTRQWFSVNLPGKPDPKAEELSVPGVKILKMKRHSRKLQRGGLTGNRFQILIRNLTDLSGRSLDFNQAQILFEKRIDLIISNGLPNYFGSQRFGKHGNNLVEGDKLMEQVLANKADSQKTRRRRPDNKQGMYLSALRSWMFNEILSKRIDSGDWSRAILGDVLLINGANKWFVVEEDEDIEGLHTRVRTGELQPSGALLGDGELASRHGARQIESQIKSNHSRWISGLERLRVKQDRRALRVIPTELSWGLRKDDSELLLDLSFFLPSGSFATMLLRELIDSVEPH